MNHLTRHNDNNHYDYYPHPPPEKLFTGIFLRWQALTAAEKVVCANIVLLPVWWLVGISTYLLLILSLAIIVYEWLSYETLSLKSPSWVVIALFIFYAYESIDTFFVYLDAYPTIDVSSDVVISLNDVIKSLFQFSIPFLVWHIQSNNLKVRLKVVAWACSISIIQMFLGWLIFQFAFPSWIDNPPRNVYAILTGKNSFNPGDVGGWTNYLAYYDEERVRFFFGHYQAAAAYLGFVSLIAIELKNKIWSCLLLVSCIFLIFLVGSRSVWLALPAALGIRFFLTLVQLRLTALVFACLAIFSFVTFSLSPITNLIFSISTDAAQSVGNARAGSTEIRSIVYQETLEKIPQKPIFGHKVEGAPAIDGNASFYVQNNTGVRIGSHSFILGDLLYKKGLVGLGIFLTAWGMLIHWFSQMRQQRPLCWLPILTFFFLQCFVASLNPIGTNTLLLMMIFCTQPKSFSWGMQ